MTGLEHNDEFEMREGRVRTKTNRSGGVQGACVNHFEWCPTSGLLICSTFCQCGWREHTY